MVVALDSYEAGLVNKPHPLLQGSVMFSVSTKERLHSLQSLVQNQNFDILFQVYLKFQDSNSRVLIQVLTFPSVGSRVTA